MTTPGSMPGLRGTLEMRLGLYFDMRNPRGWRRPWAEHYARTAELIAGAEAMGIDSVWFSEHHLFDDGYLAQPLMYAAALAGRTSRVRLGTAVVLPALKNPLHLAEEAALVDVLSDGRLELGVGAGYRRQEFAAFGVDRHRRFSVTRRNVEAVMEYWSSGRVVPGPVQEPFPWWGGFFGPRGARLAGRMGMGLLSLRSELFAEYRAGLIEGGHSGANARVGGPVSLVLTDDPERDWPVLRPYVAYQRDSYRQHGAEGTGQPASRPTDPDELVRSKSGKVPALGVMTPADAVGLIRGLCGEMPVTDVFIWASISAMPDSIQERHIELVCRELLPALAAPAAGVRSPLLARPDDPRL
jgi:alkanesulfonate monooxygenase SsuD/methylene tetrahydromethanopterin reductase-like flavin-dependent oxidoreductase (luciferase family)